MAEVVYSSVTWTAGDVITEAKMDSMVANDRAVDAMNNGVQLTERADPSTPPSNTLHLYAKDKEGVSTLYCINDAGTIIEVGQTTPAFVFPISGTVITGTNLTNALIAMRDLTIVKVFAYAKTAPTGASLIFDININGVSIWNTTQANRVLIADGENSGIEESFDIDSLTEGDILTIDIDQVGSTVSGADVTVEVKTN